MADEPIPLRRKYTKRQKAVTVGIAIASGQTAAAEATGIPLSTVHYWYKTPEFAELRTTARGEVAETMWLGVQIGVQAMVQALRDPTVSLREKTDATSMLAEKYQLLTGHATERIEARDVTGDLPDEELETLTTSIDEWLKARKSVDAELS